MKKTIVLISLLIHICDGQEDSLKSYFPLAIGNYWQYQVTHTSSLDTQKISYAFTEVLKDTIIGDKFDSYFKVKVAFGGNPLYGDTIKYLRYDSLLKSIVEYDEWGNQENILFKLDAELNECWNYFGRNICYSNIDTVPIFSKNKQYKEFAQYEMPPWGYRLAKDYGPIQIWDDQSYVISSYFVYNLVYAKIAGKEYGNHITAIDKDKYLPIYYSLFQNYPNPFNPTTTIRYSIPEKSFVKIIVYNILGEEIKKLIEKEILSGDYYVSFDGNSLPSGIYIYRLETSKYNYSRKMILLK
jgi:hypothetical protein